MTKVLCNAVMLTMLACVPAVAQQSTEKPLPRVLIIGDAVYAQHARGALSELKDQANVQFASWPKAVVPNSTIAVRHVDQLLGRKDQSGSDLPEEKWPTWNLIHFNVGLGDLIYGVPNLQSHRVLPHNAGGVIRTDKQQYERNLETLVRLLREKAPEAKVIWASTTPIRYSRQKVFKPGDEVEYNQIAQRVMKEHGVPINDMYGYVRTFMDMEKPAGHGVDPFFFDRKPLHPPVVDVIIRELGLKQINRKGDEDTAG